MKTEAQSIYIVRSNPNKLKERVDLAMRILMSYPTYQVSMMYAGQQPAVYKYETRGKKRVITDAFKKVKGSRMDGVDNRPSYGFSKKDPFPNFMYYSPEYYWDQAVVNRELSEVRKRVKRMLKTKGAVVIGPTSQVEHAIYGGVGATPLPKRMRDIVPNLKR